MTNGWEHSNIWRGTKISGNDMIKGECDEKQRKQMCSDVFFCDFQFLRKMMKTYLMTSQLERLGSAVSATLHKRLSHAASLLMTIQLIVQETVQYDF